MKKILSIALGMAIIASCSTSNEVVSNKLFQKRKYKKGWHVNTAPKIDKSTKSQSEEVVFNKASQESENNEEPKAVIKQMVSQDVAESKALKPETTKDEKVIKRDKITVESNSKNETTTNNQKEESFISVTKEEAVRSYNTNKIEKQEKPSNSDSDVALILLIILAIILPPIAVGLVKGWSSTPFLISLILFLVAIGFAGIFGIGLAGLAALIGLIYALLIVFGII